MTDEYVKEIEAPNPRAVIGGNRPPLRDLLAESHGDLLRRAAQLNDALARAPETVTDDETQGKMGDYIKAIGACVRAVDTARETEKRPFLDAGREVDGFFKQFTDSLAKTKAAVERRVTVYLNEKAAAEKRRRAEEERQARAAADRALAEAQAAEAANRKADADAALERAAIAETAATKAEAAVYAKPAEMARTRGEMGSVSTLRTTWEAEITDFAQIPLETIRAFIPRDAIEKAVKGFVRAGGRELAGVRIFEQSTAIVR